MANTFCIVYQDSKGNYKTKSYDAEHSWDAVDNFKNEFGDKIKKYLGYHQVTGNIWNDGEEPLNLTAEELYSLVQLDIKHDKAEEAISAYYSRTHWVFAVLSKVVSFPLLLLKWIGCALASPFLLFAGICESVSDWYEDKIRNFEMWVAKDKIDNLQQLRKEHANSHFKLLSKKHDKIEKND